MSNKPSGNEEEYFARKDLERLRALAEERRAKTATEELEQRKQLHFMHCPKCGDDLSEMTVRGVTVDQCPSCEGLWLDAGELQTLMVHEDKRLLERVLKVFRAPEK